MARQAESVLTPLAALAMAVIMMGSLIALNTAVVGTLHPGTEVIVGRLDDLVRGGAVRVREAITGLPGQAAEPIPIGPPTVTAFLPVTAPAEAPPAVEAAPLPAPIPDDLAITGAELHGRASAPGQAKKDAMPGPSKGSAHAWGASPPPGHSAGPAEARAAGRPPGPPPHAPAHGRGK